MNYAILFSICDKYDLDLNKIIYGKPLNPDSQLEKMQKKAFTVSADKSLAKQSVEVVDLIRNLPIPVNMRRRILESYITILNEELSEKN